LKEKLPRRGRTLGNAVADTPYTGTFNYPASRFDEGTLTVNIHYCMLSFRDAPKTVGKDT
jgi:hypothetical protein